MSGKELIKILERKGCKVIRISGSHHIVRCGKWQTTVPVHRNKDLRRGTLHSIIKDLEPCLGKGWLDEGYEEGQILGGSRRSSARKGAWHIHRPL